MRRVDLDESEVEAEWWCIDGEDGWGGWKAQDVEGATEGFEMGGEDDVA